MPVTMITKIKTLRFLLSTFAAITCASFTHCLGVASLADYQMIAGFGAHQVKISPQATWISWVQQVGDVNMLLFLPAADTSSQAKAKTGVEGGHIADYVWLDDNTIAYFWNSDGNERNKLTILNVITGDKTRVVTPDTSTVLLQGKQENELFVRCNIRDADIFDIYKVNIKETKLELFLENSQLATTLFYNKNGDLLFTLKKNEDSEIIYSVSNGEYTNILEAANGDIFHSAALGPDGTQLYLITNVGLDTLSVMTIDKKGTKTILFQNPHFDVNMAVADKNGELAAVGFYGEKQEYHFFNTQDNIFKEIIDKKKGYRVEFEDSDEAGKYMIISWRSPSERGGYEIYNTKSKEIKPIFQGLGFEERFYKTSSFNIKARDGLKLQGYLTYPHENAKPPHPAVALIHGGPWDRDYMEYDYMAQMLADRGYLVIKVNYRGSRGFGKSFMNAGSKEWGRKMQDDITDAVNWAINQKIADAKRIAIAGYSYGGYAALMALIKEPGLFRCGAAVNAPVDIHSFLEGIPKSWLSKRQFLHKMVGNPETDKACLDAVSPLYLAESIKSPVLIMQSKNDARVQKQNTDKFITLLRKQGSIFEYKVIDGGHVISNNASVLAISDAISEFLETHMPAFKTKEDMSQQQGAPE